jgi:hypothetical protein
MAEKGSDLKIPYNKRVLLGSLLDLPLDQSLQGSFINDLQLAATGTQQAQAAQAQNQSAVKPTVTGLQNLNVAGRAGTETQVVIDRRRS